MYEAGYCWASAGLLVNDGEREREGGEREMLQIRVLGALGVFIIDNMAEFFGLL